jgi:HSP90 family molecular chaperone
VVKLLCLVNEECGEFYKSFHNDWGEHLAVKHFHDHGIKMENNNERNINKNAVADKTIKERKEELFRLFHGSNPTNESSSKNDHPAD